MEGKALSLQFNRRERLTPHGQVLQLFSAVEGRELSAHLCRHEAVRDTVFLKQGLDRRQVEPDLLRNDHDRRAGGEGRIQIHHAGVKSIAGISCHTRLWRQGIEIPEPAAEVTEVPMFQNHPFRRSGRAGSIEYNKGILRLRILPDWLRCAQRGNLVQAEHIPGVIRDTAKKFTIRDEQLRFCVGNHKLQPLRRITRIQRLVSRAGFQDAKRGKYHVFAARDQHGYHIFPADPLSFQTGGNPLRGLIHLAVGQHLVLENDCRLFRHLCHAAAEQRDDVCDLIRLRRVIEAVQHPAGLTVCQFDV